MDVEALERYARETLGYDRAQDSLLASEPTLGLIELIDQTLRVQQHVHAAAASVRARALSATGAPVLSRSALEQQERTLTDMQSHLGQLVQQSSAVLTRLQLPFAGEHVNVETRHHALLADELSGMARFVTELAETIDALMWLADAFELGPVLGPLAELTSVFAKYQIFYEALLADRRAAARLGPAL